MYHDPELRVNSMQAQRPPRPDHGSSKATLVLLTNSWAAGYGPAGVRGQCRQPGRTRAEGSAAMGEPLDQLASGPGQPAGLPEKVPAAITVNCG